MPSMELMPLHKYDIIFQGDSALCHRAEKVCYALILFKNMPVFKILTNIGDVNILYIYLG